ncbi:MAG: MaoC family dehydratase N-terminal domain-containing protein [Acidobacteria bacterium]|nr:MaoC family dehydratase N-terminal domain-containing protein [Acidobacteriota bacterium]MBI3657011.1 MaoC family dehydratase N-terminal domain-containing protein [Acidobacteriota bacterium]
MGKYFEELTEGESRVSRGRTITETDIVNFAALTGDWVELHVNEEYARQSYFGRRIAHGALIFSIATGLSVRMGTVDDTVIAFYGVDKLRFVKPVFIGDTIWAREKILSKEPRDEKSGIITIQTEVINQREEVALTYTGKILIKRK